LNDIEINFKAVEKLYFRFSVFQFTIDALSSMIQRIRGINVKDLLVGKSNNKSSEADFIFVKFTLQYALVKLLISWSLEPSSLDGIGIGAYVAGAIANLFSLEDALTILSLYADIIACQPQNDKNIKNLAHFEDYVRQLKIFEPSIPVFGKNDNITQPSFWFDVLIQVPHSKISDKKDDQTFTVLFGTPSAFQVCDNRLILIDTTALEMSLLMGIGRLWEHGVKVNWDKIPFGENLKRIPLPTYPFDRKKIGLPKHSQNKLSLANLKNLTRIEGMIAIIWGNVLQLERFEKEDNFFMIGGDSLAALEVLDILKKTLCIELSLETFFANPTISQLGKIVELDIQVRASHKN
jgi:acyl carrier protein